MSCRWPTCLRKIPCRNAISRRRGDKIPDISHREKIPGVCRGQKIRNHPAIRTGYKKHIRSLAESHHGDLSVTSVVGEGSTFEAAAGRRRDLGTVRESRGIAVSGYERDALHALSSKLCTSRDPVRSSQFCCAKPRLANARESGMRIINPTIATTITITTTFGSSKLWFATTSAAAILR